MTRRVWSEDGKTLAYLRTAIEAEAECESSLGHELEITLLSTCLDCGAAL